jgi:glutamate/tyrosine decarboxylase-like PLP-dependent enzyme
VDYHKTGFAPYVSSAIFFRDAADLQLLARSPSTTPYLFQSGEYHPGRFTLETSRSGSGPLAAFASLSLLGKTGLRTLLGHLVTMAELLRDRLQSHPCVTVMNPENYGPVTLFRVYPPGVDTFEIPQRELTDAAMADQLRQHNDYNRRIFELIHEEALRGEGVVLSMTDRWRESDYGVPVSALKSYIMSPFSEEQYVQAVLESIERARKRIAGGD